MHRSTNRWAYDHLMMRSWLVVAVAVTVVAPAVAAADDGCSLAAVKVTRKAATALMKQKKYAEAVKRLSGASCLVEDGQAPALQLQTAWLVSDLAFAYLKAGQPDQCYRTAEGQLWGERPSVVYYAGQNDKLQPVIDALTYNSKVCHAAIEKARGAYIEAKACGDDGYAVPTEILPPGVKTQCVVIEGGTAQGTSEDPAHDGTGSCGAVKLVTTPAKGKPITTVLDVNGANPDGVNLTDTSICCHRAYVGFQKRAATWAMLVKTSGPSCTGGTAQTAEEAVYKLAGTGLSSDGGVAVSYH